MKTPRPSTREPLPCGCVPHETEMTNIGFHCITEDQGYCNFECPHESEPEPFTKVVNFGTVNIYKDKWVGVYVKIKFDSDGELHMTGVEGPRSNGSCAGGAGQIAMDWNRDYVEQFVRINSDWTTEKILQVVAIWDRWHLNHMNAGTPAQQECLRKYRKKVTYPQSQYDADVELLRDKGLQPDPDTGYSYGSAWLREEIPVEVLDFLRGLPETRKTPAWV